jgi:ABC-type multidrug transport system ATPase subunit
MDPATRRHLWNFLSAARKGRAIVLTTHSMEEADALCSRIAIMVQGAIRAEGTAQELKDEHGKNFVLMMRLKDSAASDPTVLERIDALVKGIDPAAELNEDHNVNLNIVRYSLSQSVGLGPIFEAVNASKEKLGLADFSVSQSSLEDAFIALANKQVSID